MRSWLKKIGKIGWFKARPLDTGRRLRAACLPVVEEVERRDYLSFSASLGAAPGPITTTQQYTAYVDTTGSVSASSDVFNWDGTNTTTVNSPADPQSAQHTYGTVGTYSPTATVTPSGGSAFTAPLSLDINFGISPTYSGKTVAKSNGATGTNNGVGMYIDGQGHIFVLATYNNGGTNELAVTEFNSNGSVDTTDGFGTNGTKVISFDSFNDTPAGIGYDSSAGDIIVAGTSHTGLSVAAISPSNGNYDTNFGSMGQVVGAASGTCSAMVIESDGKIVLIGKDNSTTTNFQAFRLTSAGATDNSFGTNGKKTVSFSGNAVAYAGVEASFIGSNSNDDDIILGGSACVSGCSHVDFAFAALKVSDGSLDPGFNTTGKQTFNFCAPNGDQDADYSLAVDTTNDRVVGGGVDNSQMGVVVLNHNGALDTTFNTSGAVTVGVGATSSADYGVAVQSSDQKIVLAGTTSGYSPFSGTSNDFAMVRLNTNGTADSTFGSSGKIATDFSNSSFNNGYDVAKAVLVDSDGTIVAVGQSGSTSSGGYIGLARYLSSNQIVVNQGPGPMAVNAADSATGGSDTAGPLDSVLTLAYRRHRSRGAPAT